MLVRRTEQRQPTTIADFGISTASKQAVSLSEFTYRKGTEIFGEREPAEHVGE